MIAAHLRAAVASDLPWLPIVEASAGEAFVATGLTLGPRSVTPAEAWRGPLASGTLWVLDDGKGRPVGFLGAELVDGGLHILELDIELALQGIGLGRKLLLHVLAWARAQGLAFVSLTTFRGVPWNGPFYRSTGFVEATGDALTPRLAAIVAEETARGLPDRCAMVWVG